VDHEVAERLRCRAPTALAGLPVRFAYLYGSRAAGSPRPDSDIDIGVMCADEVEDCERVAAGCEDALRAATQLGGIEVTVLNDAPIRFLGRVLRQRVVLFSRDEPGRVEFESRVGRMADDVEVWAAETDRELIAAIADGRR
jgi:predicted nucleotidyltransferase